MQHWNNYFLFCTFTWNFIKRIYLRYYTPLVEVNQAILAWSCRQKVISKQMMWSVSTRPQFFKAQPCCQNEIKKLDHSLSHILTHLYVLSLQRLMSNWPVNGKVIQVNNLQVVSILQSGGVIFKLLVMWPSQPIREASAAGSRLEADRTALVKYKLQTMQLFTHATSNRFRAVYYKNNKNKGVIFLL